MQSKTPREGPCGLVDCVKRKLCLYDMAEQFSQSSKEETTKLSNFMLCSEGDKRPLCMWSPFVIWVEQEERAEVNNLRLLICHFLCNLHVNG